MVEILFVDGRSEMRRLAKASLERRGHRVRLAGDGVAALQLLKADRRIDLVVCNLVMPRAGGLQLLRAARRRGYATRFVLTGGHVPADIAGRLLPDPQVGFLPEPWGITDLIDRVRVSCAPTAPRRYRFRS